MFHSKALKDWENKERPKIVELFLSYLVYPITDRYDRYKERISRTLAYARLAWLHYDFDAAYLWDVMAFKLKRIEKCLLNGHAIQEDEDMAALREAIEICERLFKDEHDDKYHQEHDKKWGELPPWDTEPSEIDSSGRLLGGRIVFRDRPKVTNPELKEQERQEFRECFEKGEQDRQKDVDRLGHILKVYSPKWWD